MSRLDAPTPIAPLAVWRIAFGLLMLAESWGAIATGWVRVNLVEPTFHFAHMDVAGWLAPLPGAGMYAYFGVMGLAALGVALGWRYRFCAVALAVLWTGAYLMQKTSYNNHYYLAVLLCWGMCLVPADRAVALTDKPRAAAYARWIRVLAQAQLLIVFTFGALAKLYPGWLSGDFIHQSFTRKAGLPVLGPLLQEDWFQDFITYGAVAFDALVIPLLMWRPTRGLAFVGLVGFNLFNSVVFQIGIFPYLVLAMTVFFFDPEAVGRWFRVPPAPAGGVPVVGRIGGPGKALLALYLAVQVALPLRHHLIAGDVNWTEEGHRLAWRMMSRAKSGTVRIEVVDPATGAVEHVDPREHLTAKQASRLTTKPDFMWQYARYLRELYAARGVPDAEVYARRSRVWLNGVGPAPLFHDSIDLASVPYHRWSHNPWVYERAE